MVNLLSKRNVIETDYSNVNQTVCMTTNKCFSKHLIRMRCGMSLKMVKKVKCPCSGAFNYQCGKDHCSVDSNACDTLKGIKKNLKQTEAKDVPAIAKCEILDTK